MRRTKQHNIYIYRVAVALLPVVAAACGALLLLAAAFIPSSMIEENVLRSAEELNQPATPLLGNDRMAYIVDYNTDALIIMESYTLNSDDLQSVFSNPMRYDGEDTQRGSLMELCEGESANVNYVRYWMGFRIFIKPLLVLFSYEGICWLISLAFFALAFAAAALTAGRIGTRAALCFGGAVCLINPAIAAHSPQHACCFLLSFIFCLYILGRNGRGRYCAAAFCVFGALTQYFDFYTAPLVTLGFPMLLLLETERQPERSLRQTLRCCGAWLYGYAAMWLCKLALTGMFTDINGLEDGFSSLSGRLGVKVVEGFEEYYSAARALKSVWGTAFPGSLTIPAALLFTAAVVISGLVYLLRGSRAERGLAASELIVMLLPLVWYAVAAQPSCIHAWFQYRSLAVLFFGAFLFISRAAVILKREKAK